MINPVYPANRLVSPYAAAHRCKIMAPPVVCLFRQVQASFYPAPRLQWHFSTTISALGSARMASGRVRSLKGKKVRTVILPLPTLFNPPYVACLPPQHSPTREVLGSLSVELYNTTKRNTRPHKPNKLAHTTPTDRTLPCAEDYVPTIITIIAFSYLPPPILACCSQSVHTPACCLLTSSRRTSTTSLQPRHPQFEEHLVPRSTLMSVDIRISLYCLDHPSRFMPVSRSQLSKVHTGDSIQNKRST